jgi:hypothetical protein
MPRKPKYVLKGTLTINGKTEKELGKEVFDRAIFDGFAKAMMHDFALGRLEGPEYECLKHVKYNPKYGLGE